MTLTRLTHFLKLTPPTIERTSSRLILPRPVNSIAAYRPTTTMSSAETNPPQPIVISGPSGTGKSTLLKRLFAAHPQKFMFSVSHTTRKPRPGEEDGVHYNYVTRPEFEALIEKGGFIEHAQFGDNLYGTSYEAVERVMREGKTCVLDIEMEGVKQMRRSHLRARYLFVAPPSFEELERRLKGRATDGEVAIAKRLDRAREEMEFAKTEGVHDKVVVNDDLEKAYKEVEAFCLGENEVEKEEKK